jgi:hypothetical protein
MLCATSVSVAFASPKRVTDSPHFRFYYDKSRTVEVDSVQRSAEAAFDRISQLLSFTPTQRIPVYLYSDRKEFIRDTGINRSELVLGVATSADEAVRLDASKIFEAPDRVVGHEIAHIFLYYDLGPSIGLLPLWMNEGIAQVAGGADGDAARARVSDAYVNGRLIPLGDLKSRFPVGDSAGLAYDESQDAVMALLDYGNGWPRVRSLLSELKTAASFDAAMRSAYGMSATDWESQWRHTAWFNARFAFWVTVAEWIVPFMMFGALVWGILTVRRHRKKQIKDEEPLVEIAPPSWWKEDQWR